MRRFLFAVALAVIGTPALAQGNPADSYPNRPVRIIVPFAPGGPTDTYARVLSDKLQASMGQPFIVENKAGATGILGTGIVATAEPDGYTLVFASNSSQVIAPMLQAKKAYDTGKDFRPLSMLLNYPLYLIVGTAVPAKTVAEFVKLAKDQPGKLNFGSPGTGSGGHLVCEMFKSTAAIDAVHIPYKGVGPAQIGLMGGEIQFVFDSVLASQALIDDGKLRGLAVTGRERLARIPNIPTLKESGYDGFEDIAIWLGMLAPIGVPDAIAKKLEAELMKAARQPDVVKRVQDSAAVLVGSTGKELADFIARETPAWEAIIRKNNITGDN